MTAAEFDCWLSATPSSSYRPKLAAERTDIDILNSLRELGTLNLDPPVGSVSAVARV